MAEKEKKGEIPSKTEKYHAWQRVKSRACMDLNSEVFIWHFRKLMSDVNLKAIIMSHKNRMTPMNHTKCGYSLVVHTSYTHGALWKAMQRDMNHPPTWMPIYGQGDLWTSAVSPNKDLMSQMHWPLTPFPRADPWIADSDKTEWGRSDQSNLILRDHGKMSHYYIVPQQD